MKLGIGFAAVATLFVVAAIVMRSGRPEARIETSAARTAARVEPAIPVPMPPKAVAPPNAPEATLATINEEIRIRATYQNYRAAVATNNGALQDALLPILLRDRKVALKYAQDDLSHSTDSFDQNVCQLTVDALNR